MGLNSIKPSKNSKYKQGYFTPTHPSKIVGNPYGIIYRSSWELELCKDLDSNPQVIRWGCECIKVRYISPLDGKPHTYFIDFYFEKKLPDGTIKKYVVEVKPKTYITPPVRGTNQKAYLEKLRRYSVIKAKMQYATKYCQERGMQYVFATEDYFKKK